MTDKELLEQFQLLITAMSNMATKGDIKNMATKDDIKNMATKDDIKNMATRDDIKNMATRGDIQKAIYESETRMQVFIENHVTDHLKVLTEGYTDLRNWQKNLDGEHQALAAKVSDLDVRVTGLENKPA